MAKTKEQIKQDIQDFAKEAVEELPVGNQAPGTIIDRNKLTARKAPWTLHSLKDFYGEVTFTPEETMPVTVNGVRVVLEADKPFTGPACFQGVYEECRRLRRLPQRISTILGPVDITLGAGALDPEPTREVNR